MSTSGGGDVEQISALVNRYALAIDAGDFEGLAELFRDGSWGDRGGYDGALAYLRSNMILYDGRPRTQHVVSNIVVTVEAAGVASAISYATVLHQLEGEGITLIGALVYRDTFWRPHGPWAFRTRALSMSLAGDLSRHLRRIPDYPTPDQL
jgi:3-phenylpropionate/cinnamic acid dioxygenase small subunit